MATPRMPVDVREEVSKTILERAVEANWEDLTFQQRSAVYTQWVTDPDIGGAIGQYLPAERIRVWIKDGPMKEYRRARRGLGPYAKYVPATEAMEGTIATVVLGRDWKVREESVQVKPSRFRAVSREGDEVLIIWGAPSDLKHIVWAGLTAPSRQDVRLVVVTTPSQPLTGDAKALVRTLEARLDTQIRVIDR